MEMALAKCGYADRQLVVATTRFSMAGFGLSQILRLKLQNSWIETNELIILCAMILISSKQLLC